MFRMENIITMKNLIRFIVSKEERSDSLMVKHQRVEVVNHHLFNEEDQDMADVD